MNISNRKIKIKNPHTIGVKSRLKEMFTYLFINTKSRLLFNLYKNEISLNKEVARDLEKYFCTLKGDIYKIKDIDAKSILLISDKVSNICSKDEFEKIQYKNIIKKLNKMFEGYTIYLKPHPNEMKELEKFSDLEGIEILNTTMSSENLINNNNFSYVCGFSSTSLITCSNIFNKQSYTLNFMLDRELLSPIGAEYVENFLELSNKFNVKILR